MSKESTNGTAMRAALSILIAIAAVAVGMLVLPAVPARAESAAVTIGQLEAQGLDVKLDRVGSAPLDRCVVTGVRNPQERTKLVRVGGRGDRDRFATVVVSRTITVSLDCSNR